MLSCVKWVAVQCTTSTAPCSKCAQRHGHSSCNHLPVPPPRRALRVLPLPVRGQRLPRLRPPLRGAHRASARRQGCGERAVAEGAGPRALPMGNWAGSVARMLSPPCLLELLGGPPAPHTVAPGRLLFNALSLVRIPACKPAGADHLVLADMGCRNTGEGHQRPLPCLCATEVWPCSNCAAGAITNLALQQSCSCLHNLLPPVCGSQYHSSLLRRPLHPAVFNAQAQSGLPFLPQFVAAGFGCFR